MKKVLFFLLLIVSIYSQDNADIIKLYNEKKYKEIAEVLNTGEYINEERKLVLTKSIVNKNLEALKALKDTNDFESRFLNYLLKLDNLELYVYYKQNNFLEAGSFNYENVIYHAIHSGSVNIIKELVKNQENLNFIVEGINVLDLAYEWGTLEVFKIIFDKVNKFEEIDLYPYDFVEVENRTEKINYILEEGTKKSILSQKMLNDIFDYYLNSGNFVKVKEMMVKYKEIKINEEIKEKLLVLSAEKKDYGFAEILIKEGILPSSSNWYAEKLINFICDKNIEKLLIENDKDISYLLAFMINELIDNNDLEKLEKILNSNYDLKNIELRENIVGTAVVDNKVEALQILKKYNMLNIEIETDILNRVLEENNFEVFKILFGQSELKDGVYDLNIILDYHRPEMIDFIINNEKTLEKQERAKQIIFTLSAMKNNKEILNYFLNKGFDINKKDEYGRTALYYIIYDCDYSDIYGINDKAISFFKEKRADFNKVDNKKSALIVAIQNGKGTELIEFLLQSKVDINYVDDNGYTAYDYVKQSNNKELDKIFKKYMKK